MIEIGKYNTLEVIKEVSFGLYLSDEEKITEILLPIKYVPEGTKPGDQITVFLYNDSENRPIATTLKPIATIGEFAFLEVIDSTEFGAFLDMGIAKDIFVPLREQTLKMVVDNRYIVYIYMDGPSSRIVASAKWNKFIEKDDLSVKEADEVQILIAEHTDIGYKCIINNKHLGLIYENEVFEPIKVGDIKRGFIKKIREENKIDVSLQAQGFAGIEDARSVLMHYLKANNGVVDLGDKSSPEEIYSVLNLSKKAFKKAVGGLYKDGLVNISDNKVSFILQGE